MMDSALQAIQTYELTSKINLYNPGGDLQSNLFVNKLRKRIRYYSNSFNNNANFEIKKILNSSK